MKLTDEISGKVDLLEKKIKYVFKDKQLAANALIHSSYYNEHKKETKSNERLEFLGDSVLSLMTCEYLYKNINENEGRLTKLKAALVCEDSLFEFASRLSLGECLMLGKGEQAGGVIRKSTLADAVEAVLGALYLDGGMETAKLFILPYITDCIRTNVSDGDYKTALQEIVQKNRGDVLKYVITNEEGPAHDKRFVCHVFINSNDMAEGAGRSKKEAEQDAAKSALKLMGVTL